MNWAWATSLDNLWRLPGFPMWLTLAAAGFFGLLVLITLARAEKSVANGALTVITLLAVGIAVAATIRGNGSSGRNLPAATVPTSTTLPALSCADELAGDVVLSACERVLFGSAESVAAAVSYTASQITRLTALGDAATANRNLTPELEALRRAVERDRFGLVAEVLQVRDHCTPTECTVFRSLTDNHQILTNMDEHLYENLVTRYAPTWNAPPSSAMGALAALPPSVPTGRPTNADFPSAASTPPVSIMTPEPGTGTAATPAAHASTPASTPSPPPRPAPNAGLAAAKKQPVPKPPRPPAAPGGPTLLSPGPSAPAAAND